MNARKTHTPLPPFLFPPFSKARLCHSLLMGHTKLEVFALRMSRRYPLHGNILVLRTM